MDSNIKAFTKGTYNVDDVENIPQDAAQDSENWITVDGKIQLSYGRETIGNQGTVGSIQNEHFGFKIDSTPVHFRKAGTAIQVLVTSTWTDVITGLTESAIYSFSNYASLAGNFVVITGIDGLYKINTASPTSYCSLFDATKNFKGNSIIDKGRMFLWNKTTDKTGLYGSYIDAQKVGTQYTSVTGEATSSLGGTLAFKASGAKRNCFSVAITLTVSGEVFTDNFLGVLTGSLGNTGTINYTTGAYTLSIAGVGTAAYLWEDSSVKGIADFTYSATRLAGEGFIIRQDEGGDPIMQILIGPDGNYYSMKKNSVYKLVMDPTDLTITNEIYRKDIGIPSVRGAISTGLGIIFINTSNPSKPELTILEKNPLGDNLLSRILFKHYAFQNFVFDEDSILDFHDRYAVVVCKTDAVLKNNILLLGNVSLETIDKQIYQVSALAKNAGYLYAGSPFEYTSYRLFVDFDDLGNKLDNYWIGKAETYESESLKKFRKLRLKGLIQASQSYEVWISYDELGFQLVGTILGSGNYVDYSNTRLVGSHLVGEADFSTTAIEAYPYFTELKLRTTKFRRREIKIIAKGMGYVSIDTLNDWDILEFEQRLPSRYRQTQNVSLDGTQTNLPND